MKRWMAVVCCLLILACAGCGKTQQTQKMYLQTAELTEKETAILQLAGADLNEKIYDFRADASLQSVRLCLYRLQDRRWEQVSDGVRAFQQDGGRIAISFDDLGAGHRFALQGKDAFSATAHRSNAPPDRTGTQMVTSWLSGCQELRYEEEIPLVLQVCTAKDEVRSYDTSCFFQPEVFEDYEFVYAVTAMFSRQTVEENDQEREGLAG
ncbi:hypothetical protein D1157_01955 [Anaerotruncus sp. X29]|jgi:hypothetical protein|uniref:hypothetical protein n=1 Tax=Anaerotruncus sp. G3(2012) TaxID=1235835 RepID=UPI00033E63C7|nr:hypothetical protein [Anaerotruncus sp. G3(2012)]EOS61552.1 hypothetical protein C814_01474 [Anaerotruncus sp. G3(2012)]MCI9235292.1 hypothetical protein [Anaerotruncus sp.]NCE73769.1 hypothetical protein [Anaerotruncus sp. X29]